MNNSKETTHLGTDKVSRYKWQLKDQSKPGKMAFLHKSQIKVDHEYQRRLNAPKALEIASNFSWIAFGVLIVASRGGQFYCMDGQHRLEGSLKRSDIQEVPCIVFDVDDIIDEACGFLSSNTLRKPVSAIDKFRAMCLSGDKHALSVNDLIKESGRVISDASDGKTVACVSALLRQAKDNMSILVSTWPLIVQLCSGRSISVYLVRAIWYLENNMPDGQSLNKGRWRDRLLSVGLDEVDRSIKSAAAYHGSMKPSSCADGILKALNHGLKNRLSLAGLDQEALK